MVPVEILLAIKLYIPIKSFLKKSKVIQKKTFQRATLIIKDIQVVDKKAVSTVVH